MAVFSGQTIVAKSLPGQSVMLLPVYGGGSDVAQGTILMRGTTASQDKGVLIPITAASNARCVGVLGELHDYSVTGDATTQTLVNWYPGFGTQNVASHNIDLIDTAHLVKVSYDLAATGIVCTGVATVTWSFGTIEADWDGGFMYVNAGTGAGQLGFIKHSTTNTSITLPSAMTAGSTDSYIVKIMPLFYDTPIWKVNTTTASTIINTSGAAGSGRAVNMANKISINGLETYLDPKAYHNKQSLNAVASLQIYSEVAIIDSVFHPIS